MFNGPLIAHMSYFICPTYIAVNSSESGCQNTQDIISAICDENLKERSILKHTKSVEILILMFSAVKLSTGAAFSLFQ